MAAQPVPLPPNPFDQSPQLDAYEVCLRSENAAGNNKVRLMYARCLGHLLREAPSLDAQDFLAHEILECVIQGTNIDKLARFYIDHLFRLFRQNKGHTPAPSEHPSRPSFEMHSIFFGIAAEPAPKSHTVAKQSALVRDGYRCMVTRHIDRATYRSMTAIQRQEHGFADNAAVTKTNFCHIFPPSTNWDLNPEEHGHPKTKYSGNLWGIINGFGGIDVLAELNGTNIHRLSNGLTMDVAFHEYFDDLALWFEAVPDVAHTYIVRTADTLGVLTNFPNPLVVTFNTTADDLELPNPKYLRLHAAVCRVAHMSGAAGYLDLFDRDVEEKGVLAYDGSSAELLVSRLSQVILVA